MIKANLSLSMNYIETISSFLKNSEQALDNSIFTSQVISDFNDTKQSMQKDEVIFLIEPQQVQEAQSETETHKVFNYKGSYFYGFQKNGVYHHVPGDLSSQGEKELQHGEFKFYLNKQTNLIDYMTEDLAGNHYGQKPKKKSFFSRFFG